MHLVLHWGAGFRKDFQQIGLALSCMPQRTVCIGVTATLPTSDTAALAQSLGLAAGSFFFSQRSNFRYDIRIEFQNLTHGLGGTIFPDLDWIIKGYRKTLVFCDSISLAFRVFGYLKKKMPSIVEHAL